MAKTGYTIVWDREVFTNIQQDITVTSIETLKMYMVTFNANGGRTSNLTPLTITYGQEYTLPTPTHANKKMIFEGWAYSGKLVEENGKWDMDVEENEIELTAIWSGNPFWMDVH